jgi:hypothetical protein
MGEELVAAFMDYVERMIKNYASTYDLGDVENEIHEVINDARLIYAVRGGLQAFHSLSSALIEASIHLDREGATLAAKVIDFYGLDPDLTLDLRRIVSRGYLPGSWRLTDIEEHVKSCKYTFYRPSVEVISQLAKGDLVKLIFEFDSENPEHPNAERMWVRVIEREKDHMKGLLDNSPFFLSDLYWGDLINFESKHILDSDLDDEVPDLVEPYRKFCIVTKRILKQKTNVNYLYREEPLPKKKDEDIEDSGWRIFSGNEDEDFIEEADNFSKVTLGIVLNLDDSFRSILDAEIGAAFERIEGMGFVQVDDEDPGSEEN